MTSLKISQITRDTAPAITDIVPTVKDPSGTPLNRAVLLEDIVDLVESETIGVTIQGYDADTLKADVADDLTAGFSVTPYSIGTLSSGSYTPVYANGNFQTLTNNGAFTLNVPASGSGTIAIEVTNGASAGAITTSAFIDLPGDTLDTVSGNHFILQIIKFGARTYLQVSAAGDNS
jgi:hypothetical protein